MQILRYCVLAAVLLTAVCTDVRFRRIPNWLTVSAAAVGLILSVFGMGIGTSLKGLLIGFAAGYLLWMLQTFRAGDAKLFAALGALMGLEWLIRCAVWSFVGGAVLGVGLLLVKGQLISRAKRVFAYFKGLALGRSFTPYQPEPGTEREFPFAVAIALGGLLACVLPL